MDPKMAMALLALLSEKRQEAVAVAGVAFDEYFEPIDLPGPDTVIDPAARAGLTLAVGWTYDSMVAKLRDMAGLVGEYPNLDHACQATILAALAKIGEGAA